MFISVRLSTFVHLIYLLSVSVVASSLKKRMNNLTLDQRKWILKCYYWKYENAAEVRRKWTQTFHTPPPSRQSIYAIRDKFDTDGTVKNKDRSGRKKTSSTEDNEMLVALTFQNSPKKSTRRTRTVWYRAIMVPCHYGTVPCH